MARPRLRSELALLHPAWLVAAFVLAFNDHVLKGAGVLPPLLTGKLSDLAGLFLAPALLAALLRAKSTRAWAASAALVGIVFSAINLSAPIAHAWTALFASIGIPFAVWSDPTDLLALPAIPLSFWVLRRAMLAPATPSLAPSRAWLPVAAAGALLCAASSPWPTAPPAVDAHNVYVEHHGGALFAVDATSGTLRGRVPTEGSNVFAPVVRDGIVYWVDADARLMAASIASPHNRWIVKERFTLGRTAEASAVDRFRVYVFDFESPARLIAIDRTTGQVLWSLTTDLLRYPAVTVVDDTVLFVNGLKLSALDARTGDVRWVFQAAEDLGRPTVTGDRIHIADDDGVLREIDLALGGELWHAQLEGQACAAYFPIAVDGSTAFVCADGELQAFDLSARKARWSRDCRGAALTPGAVACVDGDQVMALDRATGASRWKVQVDDAIWTYPVSGDGMVFVRNHVGKLYALRDTDGAAAWTLDMDEGRVVTGPGAK